MGGYDHIHSLLNSLDLSFASGGAGAMAHKSMSLASLKIVECALPGNKDGQEPLSLVMCR